MAATHETPGNARHKSNAINIISKSESDHSFAVCACQAAAAVAGHLARSALLLLP